MSRFLLATLLSGVLSGQPPVRQWRHAHEPAIVEEFAQLLSIPNTVRDSVSLRKNAGFLKIMLERRGVTARLLEAPGVPPAVFGELKNPGAQRTITFYAHYDGQLASPNEWVGGDPFKPRLGTKNFEADGQTMPLPHPGPFDPEWRVFARSASDDKGPIIALMAALDALRATGMPLKSNIQFFFEGEEEVGSPHLGQLLRQHKAVFGQSDLWIVSDGPLQQDGDQVIYFGARGIATLELTVYGPGRELHSGHYGNWAPNPAMALARLLASLKDEDGRVRVPGFYDQVAPLGAAEKEALRGIASMDGQMREELRIGRVESQGLRLSESINQPSLNVRGLRSADVGKQARNVVPSVAHASLEMRLVKGMDPHQTQEKVIAHLRQQGFFVVEQEPTADQLRSHPKVVRVNRDKGYRAVRTPMDHRVAAQVVRAVEQVRGKPSVRIPTTGGSLPLAMIEEELGVPTLSVPMWNHDARQHAANENLRLQNLWDGIEIVAALLTMD